MTLLFSRFLRITVLLGLLWGLLGCGGSFDLVDGSKESQTRGQGSDVGPSDDLNSFPPDSDLQPSPELPPSQPETLRPTGGQGGQGGLVSGQCAGRNYQVYVPPTYRSTQPAPLVAAMHGAGDTYQNFAQGLAQLGWRALADQEGFLLLTPDHTNSSRRSFLHFNQDFSLNIQNTLAEGRELLDCIYYGVGSLYNIETTQIYWLGFSEGASFTNFMVNDLSQRLRAVAIYAGASGKANPAVPRKTPLYFISGTGDFNYQGIVQASAEWLDHPNQREFVPATHSFAQLNVQVNPQAVWSWMSAVAMEPVVSGYQP